MGSVQIRSETKVYSSTEKPAVLYDQRACVMMKMGDIEMIQDAYRYMRESYLVHGYEEMANDLAILELPLNQELVDELFQSTGRFKVFMGEHVGSVI